MSVAYVVVDDHGETRNQDHFEWYGGHPDISSISTAGSWASTNGSAIPCSGNPGRQRVGGRTAGKLSANVPGELVPNHIIVDDILASINYLNCLGHDIGNVDDIDHLGNRRIRSVGELLQNQFRIGFPGWSGSSANA